MYLLSCFGKVNGDFKVEGLMKLSRIPASRGILQFDMWHTNGSGVKHNMKYNWDKLKMMICEYGLRNSLLLAPMPTASTSQQLEITNALNLLWRIFILEGYWQENI